jgi:hypothetical protein
MDEPALTRRATLAAFGLSLSYLVRLLEAQLTDDD